MIVLRRSTYKLKLGRLTPKRIAEARKAFTESRAWIITELVVVTLLVQIGLWNLGQVRKNVIIFGALWCVLTTILDGTSRKDMGLSWKNSKDMYWLIYPTLFIAVFVWVVGVICGTQDQFVHQSGTILNTKFGYILGAVIQQLLMQSYVFVRLHQLWPKTAIKHTATMFSLSHVPNPVLMILCWLLGWATTHIFKKHRCVWVLCVTHGLIGATMAEYLPAWVMRVGITFYNNHKHLLGF